MPRLLGCYAFQGIDHAAKRAVVTVTGTPHLELGAFTLAVAGIHSRAGR